MKLLLALLLAAAPLLAARAGDGDDLEAARIAWRYFERNTDPRTGLVSSVAGYPSTTAWDTGSAVLAALAAGELDLVPAPEVERRLSVLLATLERLPLFDGALPNKAYDARTARMTDYANHPSPDGIGFSAVDLGRLVSALALAGDLHPPLRRRIERALGRWNTCPLVRNGELHGVHRGADGRLASLQEGRLGYEQYAAKALALVGVDAPHARSYARHLAVLSVMGVPVPHDARDRARFGAVDALVTEPWALDALEFGLDAAAVPLAARVFEVQKRRFERTGIPTALSEDHVDRAPWFVYDAIVADGAAWRTVDPEGRAVDGLRGLSTKAAFALAALHAGDPYARILRDAAAGARDPARGWFAGRYEGGAPNRALSANTNAVVLEAILFRRHGPLQALCRDCEGRDAWRARLASLAGRHGPCPAEGPGAGGGADLSTPLEGLSPSTGQGPTGSAPPPRPASAPHVTGSFFVTYRGAAGPGAGGIATAWPWRASFLRLGGEATPQSDRGNARLVWGLGWDDWHDDTFSLTVHNWGPLRPEDAPGFRGAEANLGYKVPRLCSEWLCIAPVASVTVPFNGGPYADLRVTFILGGKWFAMGGVGYDFPGIFDPPGGPLRPFRMVYGFGRWDWRPGSLFITYHDWGPTWRDRNGVLAVGINWAF